MAGGPKAKVSDAPLSVRGLPKNDPERAIAWIEKYCIIPQGKGAGKPFVLREWQKEIVRRTFSDPQCLIHCAQLARGSGKSTLLAAMCLYAFIGRGEMSASVVCTAVDERQARITFGKCCKMVELHPQLRMRIQTFQDRLYHPKSQSELRVYPADPKSLEGLDFSFCVLDEFGVIERDQYEVLVGALGKREKATLFCIGTPSPMGADSVMWAIREAAKADPDSTSLRWTEKHAPYDCAIDDEEAWLAGSPALGDFLSLEAVRALMPPKTSEASFRRTRLNQWILESDEQWINANVWDSCTDERTVPKFTEVVLGFDGAWKGDCSALVGVTVEPVPHLFVVKLWKPPANNPDWRAPIEQIEKAIEDACDYWDVLEVACDPARYQRSISVLAGRGLPMVEFPQSPNRMIPASKSLYDALVDGDVTLSNDDDFREHALNARAKDDGRGIQVKKVSKHSEKKIDLLVAGIMAHSRARFYADKPKKRAAQLIGF